MRPIAEMGQSKEPSGRPPRFAFGAGASAQSPTDAQLCDDFEQYRYIRTVEPARPNQTLRQDNITDEEVREVQKAALKVYPDSIVSISGVTDGCDCEDGSRCTANWLASVEKIRREALSYLRLMAAGKSARCKAGRCNTLRSKPSFRASGLARSKRRGIKRSSGFSTAFRPVQLLLQSG